MNLNRREVLGTAAALLAAHRTKAQATGLRFAALDHVEFTVSGVEKSLAFYTRIFSIDVMKNNKTTRRYLKLGSAYIALDKAEQIRVDHFCAGIDGFDVSAVHTFLQQRGIAYRDFPSGKDLAITDADGTRTQLATSNGWEQLKTGTASPEAVPSAEPIFRATGLDHILLNVSDPEKSAGFYEKIFGPVTRRNNNRIWFQVGSSRIGLLKTPEGAKAGVNHYCVSAAAFDYDTVVKQLAAAGAKVETPEIAGAPEFRDPDGFLVQVQPV
jgi:catechol 2,3-dioxygenase-like lactoylglutathione lyase family enzyme